MTKTATRSASFSARKQSQIEQLAKISLDREIISLAESAAKDEDVSLGEWILRECKSSVIILA